MGGTEGAPVAGGGGGGEQKRDWPEQHISRQGQLV